MKKEYRFTLREVVGHQVEDAIYNIIEDKIPDYNNDVEYLDIDLIVIVNKR